MLNEELKTKTAGELKFTKSETTFNQTPSVVKKESLMVQISGHSQGRSPIINSIDRKNTVSNGKFWM